MENIYCSLFQQNGSIEIDGSDNLKYNQASEPNSNNSYCLVNQKIFSTFPTVSIPDLDISKTEDLAQMNLDFITHDSIIKRIDGTYIPESIHPIKRTRIRDTLKFNRRFSDKNTLYLARTNNDMKIYKFMQKSYDIFMTIPCDLLLEEFRQDAERRRAKETEICHANTRLTSIEICGVVIFVHIDSDPFRLIFSRIEKSELLKLKELQFTMEILEVRILNKNGDKIFMQARCAYLYHILRVKLKNRNGQLSSDKLSVRVLSTLTFDSQIMYSCTNLLNEHLICTEKDLLLYDSNFTMVDSITLNTGPKFKYKFSRGTFLDHPRTLLQLSDHNILSFDFRICNHDVRPDRSYDSLVAWLNKNEEVLCPVIGSSPASSYIYYTGSNKNINFIDMRNPHSFFCAHEHKLNIPSYSISIPGDPGFMLFYSFRNNMNTVGLILQHDAVLNPSYMSVITVPNEPLVNILGVDAKIEDGNLFTNVLGSNGTLYSQVYSKCRSETILEYHTNYPVRSRDCPLVPPIQIDPSYLECNKFLFKWMGKCIAGKYIPDPEPKFTRTYKKISWEKIVNSELDTYPKVSEYYHQWFPDPGTDTHGRVTDEISTDVGKRKLVIDSNSDEGL